MTLPNRTSSIFAAMLLLAATTAQGQQDVTPVKPIDPPAAIAPMTARELTMGKCFQCHTQAMWRDQRTDARGWEATLYRMVARGAAWTGEDIKTMASYLATDFGPNSPRPEPVKR
ncbi:MAG: hypothetical protein M3150_01880 [Pseudomonadota bacterium]|nr:hypothetical protein [Pseudomonadota bacterium]